MVGMSQGRAVLDAALAAANVPGTGLSIAWPVFAWGYSQGGNATIEAGEIWQAYNPALHLVGVASGGVPSNVVDTTIASNASLGTGFMLGALIGLDSAYPNLPFTSLLNSAGQTLVAKLKANCMITDLFDTAFKNFDQLTNGGLTLQEIYSRGAWTQDLLANSVGLPGAHIPVAVFNYRRIADEVIQTSVEDSVWANL